MSVGRSDWPIIKTHILFPPPLHFSKISFFFGPRPSLQKTNYKCKHKYEDYFLTTNKRQIRWLAFFPREMITNLTPCWHLVDTLLTPCWSFFQMCKCTNVQCAIVTTWHFLQCLSSIAMAKYFHAKWTIHFSSCHDQIFSIDFPNASRRSLSFQYQHWSVVKKVWELKTLP